MKTIPLYVENIVVSFECPCCGEQVECDVNNIAEPNMSADSVSDSENSDSDEVECECGCSFTITNYANMNERNIEVEDGNGNIIKPIEVTYDHIDESI